jgi:hypothetical protein
MKLIPDKKIMSLANVRDNYSLAGASTRIASK